MGYVLLIYLMPLNSNMTVEDITSEFSFNTEIINTATRFKVYKIASMIMCIFYASFSKNVSALSCKIIDIPTKYRPVYNTDFIGISLSDGSLLHCLVSQTGVVTTSNSTINNKSANGISFSCIYIL